MIFTLGIRLIEWSARLRVNLLTVFIVLLVTTHILTIPFAMISRSLDADIAYYPPNDLAKLYFLGSSGVSIFIAAMG